MSTFYSNINCDDETAEVVGGVGGGGGGCGVMTRNRRRQIKEFNEVITCGVCRGYLVEATTVNECLHAFCRSCILKHLIKHKHCPRCKSFGKVINSSNLRHDRAMQALVYKMVPGLYHSEYQRLVKFKIENNIDQPPPQDFDQADNDMYCSTSTPTLSSSTEYLFDDGEFYSPDEPISLSLEYHLSSVIEQEDQSDLPPPRFLQCPAAVTVRHLQRFLSSKFDLNTDKNCSIEIIYEDEILPIDFSLMDVAYCYHWDRAAPMQFFYRIFLRSDGTVFKVPTPIVSTNNLNVKHASPKLEFNTDLETPSTNTKKIMKCEQSESPTNNTSPTSELATTATNNNNNTLYKSNLTCKIKTETNNGGSKEKTITINNNNNERETKRVHFEKPIKSQTPPTNDFKILRSNFESKIPHHEVTTKSSSVTGIEHNLKRSHSLTVTTKTTKFNEDNDDDDDVFPPPKRSKSTSSRHRNETHKKKYTFDDETTSDAEDDVPTPKSSTSNDSEEIALSKLKKRSSSLTSTDGQSCGKELKDSRKYEVQSIPKLKIQNIPNLKTKFTVPKIDKSPPVVEKEEDQVNYAKNIGLLPNFSPDDSKNGKRDDDFTSLHRKRKKAKHSRDPNSSKRRKMHAEISSQDESLKVKVKLIPSHKADRKSSPNASPLSTPKTPTPPPVTAPAISYPLPTPAITIPQDPILPKSPQPQNFDKNEEDLEDIIKGNKISKIPEVLPKVEEKPKEIRPMAIEKPMVNIPHLNPTHLESKDPLFLLNVPSGSPKSESKLSPKPFQSKSPGPVQTASKPTTPISTSSSSLSSIRTNFSPPNTYRKPTDFQQKSVTQPRPQIPSIKRQNKPPPFNFQAKPNLPQQYPLPRTPYPTHLIPPKSRQDITKSQQPVYDLNDDRDKLKRRPVPTTSPNVTSSKLNNHHHQSQMNRKSNESKQSSSSPRSSNSNGESKATSQSEKYYKSSIGSSFIQENHTKKPMPIQLPPSSISVTKMTDEPSPPPIVQNLETRPSLEIVRISSSVPAIDEKHTTTTTAPSKTPNKPNRPPPPLIKRTVPGQMSLQSKMAQTIRRTSQGDVPQKQTTDYSCVLDLSGKSSRSPTASPSSSSGEKSRNNSIEEKPTKHSSPPRYENTTKSFDHKNVNKLAEINSALISGNDPKTKEKYEKNNLSSSSPSSSSTKELNTKTTSTTTLNSSKLTANTISSTSSTTTDCQKYNTLSKQKNIADMFPSSAWSIKMEPNIKSTSSNTNPLGKINNRNDKVVSIHELNSRHNNNNNNNNSLKMNSSKLTLSKNLAALSSGNGIGGVGSIGGSNGNAKPPPPKLNEITKVRSSLPPNQPMRQQNLAMRNIPNPSALAFRNQQNHSVKTSSSTTTSTTINTMIPSSRPHNEGLSSINNSSSSTNLSNRHSYSSSSTNRTNNSSGTNSTNSSSTMHKKTEIKGIEKVVAHLKANAVDSRSNLNMV